MTEKQFDVIATNLKTYKHRVVATEETEANAEAIVRMAVVRRGADKEFFSLVPSKGQPT